MLANLSLSPPPGLSPNPTAWSVLDIEQACRMTASADGALDDWRLLIGAAIVHQTRKFSGERARLIEKLVADTGVALRTLYRWVEIVEADLAELAGGHEQEFPWLAPEPPDPPSIPGRRPYRLRRTVTWSQMRTLAEDVDDPDVCRRVAELWLTRAAEIEAQRAEAPR